MRKKSSKSSKAVQTMNTVTELSRYFLYGFVLSFFAVLFIGGGLIKWIATSSTSAYDVDYFRADLILMIFLFAGQIIIASLAKTKIRFYGFSFGLLGAIVLALIYYHIWLFV